MLQSFLINCCNTYTGYCLDLEQQKEQEANVRGQWKVCTGIGIKIKCIIVARAQICDKLQKKML